jgi:Uma2 family endonuclease
MTVMPRDAREWTVADLEHLPDDGLQYELLDGMLLVTPAPIVRHQAMSARLFALLDAACPEGLHVLFAPLDWQPDDRTSLQPDLLVIRHLDLSAKNVSGPLPLAVEVLSPSTRRKDLLLKRSKYQDAGVESYWIVDPVALSILALDLVDGEYVTAGEAAGAQALSLSRPFPITVTPAALVPS